MLAPEFSFCGKDFAVGITGVLDNTVTMNIPSSQHGAGSFPPLAGADNDAGHSGTIVRAIAARIRVTGRRVSRELDRVGILQSAGADGAGNFQKTIFLARGKGGGGVARHRREVGALERAGVSTELAADL